METNELYLTGRCPYCHTTLDYAEGRNAVRCHCCNRNIAVSTLLLDRQQPDEVISEEDRIVTESVASVSAGLVYFDNFCETFDWDKFVASPSLTIPRINAIAESYKLKYATNPLTYVLDFRRIVLPVAKKIEGLKKVESELVEKSKNEDVSVLFSYYDRYHAIAETIMNEKESMIRILENDIRLAEKYGADYDIVESLKIGFDEFTDAIRDVKPVEDIRSSGIFARCKERRDTKLARELTAKGINAQATYAKAKQLLQDGNTDNALHLLLAIRPFKDSETILAKHTGCFVFNDEFIELAGKQFYLTDGTNTYFDPSDPTGYRSCACKNLYEIQNGVPVTTPTVTGVTRIIGAFGTRIFYIKNNDRICCYNTKPSETYISERVLITAPYGDFVCDEEYNRIEFSKDMSRFFIRRKLREAKAEKRGCALFRKKKAAPRIDRRNNYSIIMVDMNRVTANVVIPECVDVLDYFGDTIFYNVLGSTSGVTFRMYNIKTEVDDTILDEECVIHDLIGNRIIYSVFAPNAYNMNLYTVDLVSRQPKLIEQNIYQYYATSGNKIFYTIGNDTVSRLYSANYDGTEKFEIMSDIASIHTITEDYIYYIKGADRNAVLMRIGTNGENPTRIASRLSRVVKLSGGYIYYVNAEDELHSVRLDGVGDKCIANEVSKDDIIIDDKNIFYLRREFVGNVSLDEDKMAYSLYKTDLSGKMLKKIAFNVVSIKEYSERMIYICLKENAVFALTNPVSKKDFETSTVETPLTSYVSYNKRTDKTEQMLNVGQPTPDSQVFRTGCFPFRKNKTVTGSVQKKTHRESYIRVGVAKAGAVYEEELEAQRLLEEEKEKEKLGISSEVQDENVLKEQAETPLIPETVDGASENAANENQQ